MSKSEIKSPEQILFEIGQEKFYLNPFSEEQLEVILKVCEEAIKQAVKVTMEEAAKNAEAYTHSGGKISVSSDSILSLEQSILNKLGV